MKPREKTAEEFAQMYAFDMKYIPKVGTIFKSTDTKFLTYLHTAENSAKGMVATYKEANLSTAAIEKQLEKYTQNIKEQENEYNSLIKNKADVDTINQTAKSIIQNKINASHAEQYLKNNLAQKYDLPVKVTNLLSYADMKQAEQGAKGNLPKLEGSEHARKYFNTIDYNLRQIDKNPSKELAKTLVNKYVEKFIVENNNYQYTPISKRASHDNDIANMSYEAINERIAQLDKDSNDTTKDTQASNDASERALLVDELVKRQEFTSPKSNSWNDNKNNNNNNFSTSSTLFRSANKAAKTDKWIEEQQYGYWKKK